MVQALSVSTGVPTALGETFAADQFLTSEQNSAIFDIALLAPTLIANGSKAESALATPGTADASSSAEGISIQGSVDIPTGNDIAPVSSALATTPNLAVAPTDHTDHDVALALAALAALEQTGRSPLIAQKASADLLPQSLKTWFGNEFAQPPLTAGAAIAPDASLQPILADLASDASINASLKQDEKNSPASQHQGETHGEASTVREAGFLEPDQNQIGNTNIVNMLVSPVEGRSDKAIIISDSHDVKSEIFRDVISSNPGERSPQAPIASELSLSPEIMPQSLEPGLQVAKSFIVQSEFKVQENSPALHNNIQIPAIVDAPREERPSFIGELIETPKPIILPNQPVPDAPRRPLSDPASHHESSAFVFVGEYFPSTNSHVIKTNDQQDQAISNQIINDGMAPETMPPFPNQFGLLKKSHPLSDKAEQNLTSDQSHLVAPVLESAVAQPSEKPEKTLENKDYLTDGSLDSVVTIYQSKDQDLSLGADIKISSPEDGKASLLQSNFAGKKSAVDHFISRNVKDQTSDSPDSIDPSFLIMGGVIAPQSLVSQHDMVRDVTSEKKSTDEVAISDVIQSSRRGNAFVYQFNETSVSFMKTNREDVKVAELNVSEDQKAEIQKKVTPENQTRAETITHADLTPVLPTPKMETAARDHMTPSLPSDDTKSDSAEHRPEQTLPLRGNEPMKDQTSSHQDAHKNPLRHEAPAMIGLDVNPDRNDDQVMTAFNTNLNAKILKETPDLEPVTRLAKDDQNAPPPTEAKAVAVDSAPRHLIDGADIRDVTLVVRRMDQGEPNHIQRPSVSIPASAPEPGVTSFAAPVATTQETIAAPVYASSDNPMFQFLRDRALQSQIIAALKAGRDEVRLSLYPPQLGQVTINLALDGQKVKVGLKTASREASDLLTTEKPSLSHALQQEGFTLDGFDVTEDDAHKDRKGGAEQTKTTPMPTLSESSEFSIDITI